MTKLAVLLRMSLFILLVICTSESQARSQNQKVTLSVNSETLQRVFKEIKKQTGLVVFYSDALINDKEKISINVKDESLSIVLDRIIANKPLRYEIQEKYIVISAKVETKPAIQNSNNVFNIPPSLIDVHGTVKDETGKPVIGASVWVKGTNIGTTSNDHGEFNLNAVDEKSILVISAINIETREVKVNGQKEITLVAKIKVSKLEDIEITAVNTGYQQIPKERATGSFVQIDNQLFNRRISTDVMSKLEDVTSGLAFNRGNGSGNDPISIRGRSTIFGNPQPLIVLDNFPFDGDLNDINPNDVESITVLKDAAAASIWGARAGNGVIVVTTKKGKYNRTAQVSFNSNVTVGAKPNVFYQPRMSSADFISIEELLFSQGFYKSTETSASNKPLTPVVELLIAARDGKISTASANQQITALGNVDVRNDFARYLYQKSLNQQYALNVSGGSEVQKYYISAGVDHNSDNLVNNGYGRSTVKASNTYSLFQHKLELTGNIALTQSKTTLNNPGINLIGLLAGNGQSLFPYAQLADAQGNPLPITHDYRSSFVSAAQQKGFLNWQYNPLDEIRLADNTSQINDELLSLGLSYKLLSQFTVQGIYQYDHSTNSTRNLQSQETYYTRDLINKFTVVNANGSLTYPVPLGGILDLGNTTLYSKTFRGQLSYDNTWHRKKDQELTAIAGYEIRDFQTQGYGYRLYGYNNEHATNTPVSYTSQFVQSYFPADAEFIPNMDGESQLTDRYISYYSNAAYTFDKRYILSASARLDRSNLFGVNSNQQGVPLYSAGAAWNVSNERFYQVAWLPYLKMRVTFGYNGNVDKNLSAYTTANYIAANVINIPFANITNPPNADLRWERDKVVNFGVDFDSRNHRIGGTIEFYIKNGVDLIGTTPYPASSGITTFTGNTANTTGHGLDITLNSRNFDGRFKWYTSLLFSYQTDVVTHYDGASAAATYVSLGDQGAYPMAGKPLFSFYSYQWAGLNPQTGDPQGYLNGAPSNNYNAITTAATPANLVYSGSSRPLEFGSVLNTLAYGNLSISFNIAYRLNYSYRENGIAYSTVLKGTGYVYGDYSQRWQKPGDEAFTHVPSLPAVANANRDNLYRYSEILIHKADNIRLRDINISYSLDKTKFKRLRVKDMQVFLYANNLGIIWKATKSSLDPDYITALSPPVRTISIGLKTNF